MTQFTELNLNPALLSALAAKGYSQPTPIQAQAIPGVMSGRDLLGIAQTGTGKTAAFALPILHRLAANRKPAPKRGCRALVLSPTRELATQIADSFKAYGAGLKMTVATVFGGVSHGPQREALRRGVDVVVAAPGRLLDHMDAGDCDISNVEIFVLDEADQMLDMGFIDPIRRIVRKLPKVRQNLFFSATMPTDIGKLAGELLNDPLRVSVTPAATTVERIDQQVIFVDAARKRGLLVELFSRPDFTRVLVFTRTKRGADKVARILEQAGVNASAIHGNKSQNQREKALAAFKAGEVKALVATDIAARGIDISSVTHVVQYELPNIPESYVHRIGRTARAGKDGSAVAFCAEDERAYLRDIERVTRQKIPAVDRRSDAALAQLAAANPEVKAESRGPAQPRRQQPQRHAHGQPKPQGEGKSRRRRGGKGGGHAQQGQGQQAQGQAAHKQHGQKPQGQKSQAQQGQPQQARNDHQKKPHRKGGNGQPRQQHGERRDTQGQDRRQGNSSNGVSAKELMRHLSGQV